MKIIFLDFDGVINNVDVHGHQGIEIQISDVNEKYTKGKFIAKVDGINLHWICQLFKYCKEQDIKIVISSSWRYLYKTDDFELFFNNLFTFNFLKKYKDKTLFLDRTDRDDEDRGIQILNWIDSYEIAFNEKIEKYIVIDDEIDYDISKHIYEEHLCRTETKNGFLEEHLIKIKNYFSE